MLWPTKYKVQATLFVLRPQYFFNQVNAVSLFALFYRKQLDSRLQPGGVDFREAVAKEVGSVEQRYGQREVELQEKLAEGRRQYSALEDEFRMALTIEAARFSEVC